jgi:hypothetical protein
MFKKAANIAFALFFLLTTSGLIIQENFCYNKLVSIYIEKTSVNCCDNPCSGCHKKVILVKVQDKFIVSDYKQVPEKIAFKHLCFHHNSNPYNCSSEKYHILRTYYFALFKYVFSTAQLMVFRC